MDRPLTVTWASIAISLTFFVYGITFSQSIPNDPEFLPLVPQRLMHAVCLLVTLYVIYRAYMGNRTIVYLITFNLVLSPFIVVQQNPPYVWALMCSYTLGVILYFTPSARKWYAAKQTHKAT
jgi:hypothetical protein